MNKPSGLSITAPDALATLKEYEGAADQLLAVSDKAAVERAARVLALYVGHYQRRYGPVATGALETSAGTLSTPEQVADRVEAMRVLAAALTVARLAAAITDETDDEPPAGG